MKISLHQQESFERRHHGQSPKDLQEMLKTVGVATLDELIEQTVPAAIRLAQPLNLPAPKSEFDFLNDLKK